MLNIVKTENPILLEKAQEVNKFDKKLQNIILERNETLKATSDPIGVGLAAPQVGIPLRLFLARPNEKTEAKVFVNPEIIGKIDIQDKDNQNSGKPKRKRQK